MPKGNPIHSGGGVVTKPAKRFGRWLGKVIFYVTVGVGIAAVLDQSHFVVFLSSSSGSHSVPEVVMMKQSEPCSSSSPSKSSSSSQLSVQPKQGQLSPHDQDPKKVVFFHVHDAKSAGSSLNRYLARKYYAVCGHKGYSYDQLLEVGEPRFDSKSLYGPDRVMWGDMTTRGFHNCKLISHETKWYEAINIIRDLKDLGLKVHVLIPCRDPISHRISKCAYRKTNLHLWAAKSDNYLCNMIINDCELEENRYSEEFATVADEVSYFWYKNFTEVDHLVEGYLPLRGYELPDAQKVYITNTNYDPKLLEQVIRRCGDKVNQYFIQNRPLYKDCAKHVPQMNRIP